MVRRRLLHRMLLSVLMMLHLRLRAHGRSKSSKRIERNVGGMSVLGQHGGIEWRVRLISHRDGDSRCGEGGRGRWRVEEDGAEEGGGRGAGAGVLGSLAWLAFEAGRRALYQRREDVRAGKSGKPKRRRRTRILKLASVPSARKSDTCAVFIPSGTPCAFCKLNKAVSRNALNLGQNMDTGAPPAPAVSKMSMAMLSCCQA